MLLLVLKLLQRLPRLCHNMIHQTFLLPSTLPLSQLLVSSARDTFATAASGRDELGAPELASLLAFLSIPSAYASHFAPSGSGNNGVTFDAFLRGLVEHS
jgi:hypothetical protein